MDELLHQLIVALALLFIMCLAIDAFLRGLGFKFRLTKWLWKKLVQGIKFLARKLAQGLLYLLKQVFVLSGRGLRALYREIVAYRQRRRQLNRPPEQPEQK